MKTEERHVGCIQEEERLIRLIAELVAALTACTEKLELWGPHFFACAERARRVLAKAQGYDVSMEQSQRPTAATGGPSFDRLLSRAG